MFENTEHFDFDDNAVLDTSFMPVSNSTPAFHVPNKLNKELNKEVFKKFKSITSKDKITVSNDTTVEYIPLQRNLNSDKFTSPNRVIKRKFPGPAGLLPEIEASNKSILQFLENEKVEDDGAKDIPILSQQTNSVFEDGPWKEMSKDYHIQNGENLLERFNIKWIKKQALKQLLNHKAPFLAAIIQNLDILDGKIPTINVTLKDSTGDIRGTILYSLYGEYSDYFRIGSVLVLKHFGVLSAGYNKHCLTITPNNLIAIYCQEAPKKQDNNNIGNIYGESSKSGIKKIVIQDSKVETILKKYNEDVMAYSEEKPKKINFGNLYKNCSEAGTSFGSNNNNIPTNYKLMSPFLYDSSKPNNESVSRNMINQRVSMSSNVNTVAEMPSCSTEVVRHDTPIKKKFDIKESYFTKNIAIVNNENINLTDSKKSNEEVETCDSIVISSSQISVKPDCKEHTEIWKNLLEGLDTDALFGDF